MASRILTPANQITILRLVFIPVFAILVINREFRAALLILTAAALSDVVDGRVARLLKQETPLGVALDPIADKILMTTAYVTLAFRDALPWWLTILVISRDVAIIMTALLISLVAGYRPFHPSLLGKVSTVAQVATVTVALSFAARIPYATERLVQAFVYLTATLTVASGIHYLIVVRHRYGHPPQESSVSERNVVVNEPMESGRPSSKSSARRPT
jgi:cardiolipin synthase (CMP-forming)